MVNMFSNCDRKIMADWINEYAGGNSSVDSSDVPTIFYYWADGKKELYKAFLNAPEEQKTDSPFILRKHFAIEKSADRLVEDFRKSCPSTARHFYGDLYSIGYTLYSNDEWHKSNLFFKYVACWESLAKNIYESETSLDVPLANGKKFRLTKGCRLNKILRRLAESYNLHNYEEFREYQAKYNTDAYLTGYLYLSIHPMDFMTMSDNTNGWDSCMSWRNEGSYRTGTVEMMNSPNVVIAYFIADSDFKTPLEFRDSTWNNKTWRELIIADKAVVEEIRPYPFFNSDLERASVEWTAQIMSTLGYEYGPLCLDGGIEHAEKENVPVLSAEEYDYTFETDQMYNDTGRNDGFCRYNVAEEYKGTHYLNYSGINSCMICGEKNCCNESELLTCCEHSAAMGEECSCCGERVPEDEVYYVDGETLCPYCFEDKTYFCYDDEDDHLIENTVVIYLDVNPSSEYERERFEVCNSFSCVHLTKYFYEHSSDEEFYREVGFARANVKTKEATHIWQDDILYVPFEEVDPEYLGDVFDYSV